MAKQTSKIADQIRKMADPDFNKRQAMLAFDSAQAWRREKVLEIYDNVTNQELDRAVRWISYAAPFAKERSCYHCLQSWKQIQQCTNHVVPKFCLE